jgi:hypothetical protein
MSTAIIQSTYEHLEQLDEQVDLATSAFYRHLAQNIIADLEIGLTHRQLIADRLNIINQRLANQNANLEEHSY